MRGFMAFLLFFVVFCTIALSSCGSGGGGSESLSVEGGSTCVWDSASSTWDNCSWGP